MRASNSLILLEMFALSVSASVYQRAGGMQLEEQNQTAVVSEIGRPANAMPIKKQHGGKRPGAARKPNIAKRLLNGVKPMTAAEALEGIDVRAIVHDLHIQLSLCSCRKSEDIRIAIRKSRRQLRPGVSTKNSVRVEPVELERKER